MTNSPRRHLHSFVRFTFGACVLLVLLTAAHCFAAEPDDDAPAPPKKSKPAATAPSGPAVPTVAWEFNEGKDSAVGDSANHAFSGKIVGGPEWVKGRESGAMRFDGKDDYVELPAPLPDADAMSVEVWMKLDDNATGVNTVFCDGDAASESDFWIGVEPEGVLICASKDGKPLGLKKTNGNQPFDRVVLDQDIRGKWVHLVWSMDDAQSVIYIDGKPVGTIAKGGSNVGNHNGHPTIGCLSVGSGKGDAKRPPAKFFEGVIDSLRLYSEALNDDQVSELYSGPKKPPVVARKRYAVPAGPALDAATKSIRETFKDDYAARSPDARKVLGDRLAAAAESETDPAMQFTLLREARDSYAGAGDVEHALQASSALADRFILSVAEVKLEALAIAVKGPNLAGNGKAIADGAIGAANVLVSATKYSAALKALSIADTAAKGAKDSALGSVIRDRSREIKEIQTQWLKVESAAASLDVKPDDPDANLRVGKFFCFVAGNWDQGLPMLAKSSDAKLKALAEKDLSAPADAAGRLAVGNGWWDYAPNVIPPTAAPLVKSRAATWYELALPDLDETAAAHVKGRIGEAQSGSKVNVLVLADPKVDEKQGKWHLARGMLASESSKYARYEFPYQPPEEYDLRVVMTPGAGDNHIAVLFPTGSGSYAFNITANAVTFEDPNNRMGRGRGPGGGGFPGRGPGGNDSLTHRLNRNLTLGQRHTIVVKVRDAGIVVLLDGEQMFKLDSDAADIKPSRIWRLSEPKCVAVGSNATESVVYAVEVLEVRGKGSTVKKPAESAAAKE